MARQRSMSSADIKRLSEDKKSFLKKQSVEVADAPEIEGQTKPIRNARHPERLVNNDPELLEVTTLWSALTNTVSRFGDRNAFGTRVKGKGYQWLTYRQFKDKALNFASGMRSLGLNPKDRVGIYSKNRVEWVIAEYAANSQAMPTVAIYDTFGPAVIEYILNHAEIPVVVTSAEGTKKILQVAEKCPTLKYVVQMEPLDEAMTEEAKKYPSVTLISFADVEEKGTKSPVEPNPPEPSDLAVIMYTSGTTGPPKGVMHAHSNILAFVSALRVGVQGFSVEPTDVFISYLPLAHIFERAAQAFFITGGGSIGFYSGDPKELVNDIQELRPTVLCGVPRIFERIYSGINSTVDTSGFLKKKLFHSAYNAKSKAFNSGALFDVAEKQTSFWNKVVFSKLKNRLGGSVRLIISGAAPLSPQIHQFVKVCFGCPVVQGYGLTETCAGGTLMDIDDPHVGHIGAPIWCCEMKLVSVPEMDYHAKNHEGEIWIRGPNVALGYYKDPEKTKEDFDDDRWFHTGDIGRWNPNGTFSIIDRKKNIFKLSHGEYVASEKLELSYAASRFVAQLFVYGDSYTPFLICIVVPDPKYVERWAKEQKLTKSDTLVGEEYEKIATSPELNKAIMDEFTTIHKKAQLNGIEAIKAIIVSPKEWTPETELVTPTMKLKRPSLKKHFEEAIVETYKKLGVDLPYGKKESGKEEKK